MTQKFMVGMLNTSLVAGLGVAAAGVLLSVSRKRYSARCRKGIWIFMAICFLMPFHLFRFPGTYSLEVPNVVLHEFERRTVNGAGNAGGMDGVGQDAQNQAVQNGKLQVPVESAVKINLTVADVLFAVWAIVCVALTVYFAEGYRRMRGKIRRWSTRCEDEGVQEIFSELAAGCGLKRIPEVRIVRDSSAGPFTTGVVKNMIILPEEALPEKDLRFILKHELIHCKNRDILWRLLFLTVNVIHWFNPFAWFLRKAAEQDMEIACDEAVVARASRADRKEYSDVIMAWVERSRYEGSVVSTGYVQEVKFLKRRFDGIFSGGGKKKGILLAGGVFVIVLLTGCILHIQSGGNVFAARKIPVDYGIEVRTDVDGDGGTDKVFTRDNVSGDYAFTQVHVQFSDGQIARRDYPDYWGSYIVTGDLNGDGAADVVSMRISKGSTYGGGEVSVLHAGTDEAGEKTILEYPSHFIQNPDLELKWVGWESYTGEDIPDDEYYTAQPESFAPENWDFSCMGAAIIEKDGKTMLRLIAFLDKSAECVVSAKCIDCTWHGDGWYIEDIQMIYDYWGDDWEDKLLGGIL